MEFVRVKRRHDEDPFNSIVVSHKKLKTTGSNSSRDCVFQFAATVKDENENLSQILKDVRESKSVKCLTKINRNKNTNNVVAHSKAKRLKMLDTLRPVKQDTVSVEEKDGESSEIKVVDFVKQTKDNEATIALIDDEGISIDYVYDVYYSLDNDDKSIDITDIDSVHELESVTFQSLCSNQNHFLRTSQYNEEIDDDNDDDDDSNDEGNWRNDYPDEDDMVNSDNDNDFESLAATTRQWNINNSSSSTDAEDEDDNEDHTTDYDVRFARYKERVKSQEHYFYNSIMENSASGSSDSND